MTTTNLFPASETFQRGARAAEIAAAGCEAQLNAKCGRCAVLIVAEGEAPGPMTPAWRLHAICAPCAVELGLKLRDDAA